MEYVGNRFACKAEADLVQLAKAKASAVVAHEGGKVGRPWVGGRVGLMGWTGWVWVRFNTLMVT